MSADNYAPVTKSHAKSMLYRRENPHGDTAALSDGEIDMALAMLVSVMEANEKAWAREREAELLLKRYQHGVSQSLANGRIVDQASLESLMDKTNRFLRPTAEASKCQCVDIMAADQTRHFRGCPLREKYPTHEAEGAFEKELEAQRKRMASDANGYAGQHANVEVARVREAVQFLLAHAHQLGDINEDANETIKGMDQAQTNQAKEIIRLRRQVDALEKKVEDSRGDIPLDILKRIESLEERTKVIEYPRQQIQERIERLEGKMGLIASASFFDRIKALEEIPHKVMREEHEALVARIEILEARYYQRQVDAREQLDDRLDFASVPRGDDDDSDELLAHAWSVIANAYNGDWNAAPQEWHMAAIMWRERYMKDDLAAGRTSAFMPLPKSSGPITDEKVPEELSDKALLKRAIDFLDGVGHMASGTILYTGGPNVGKRLPTQEAEMLATIFVAVRNTAWAAKIHREIPFQHDRPKIVCLCGSTRFAKAFADANLTETLAGNAVFTVGSMMHSDADILVCVHCKKPDFIGGSCEGGFTHTYEVLTHEYHSETKKKLDELHKRKIEMSDEVFCLNAKHCVDCGGIQDKQFERWGHDLTKCAHWREHEKGWAPYIGESTRSEIAHALKLGKKIRFLNPQGPQGCVQLDANDTSGNTVEQTMRDLGLGE